jgi:hypothetical protein
LRSKNFGQPRDFLTANIESLRGGIHFCQAIDDSFDEFLVASELIAKALKIGVGDLHTQIPQIALKNFLQ